MAKKAPEPKKPLLGRFSSHLKMGIVGLPNVGKSTLFNTMTKMSVPAENFPFCTIDPTEARVAVPDARFDKLVEQFKPKSVVPSFLTVTDIAGLVRGASNGEGLGNAFLSNIQATDGIFHVVRIFDDADVTHVEGELDPIRDMEIISEELRLKDISMMEKHCDHFNKVVLRMDKTKKAEADINQELLEHLKEKKQEIRYGDWSARHIEVINSIPFLTSKPVVYLVNMTEKDYVSKKNRWLAKVKAWIDEHGGAPIIPFCGALEAKLVTMSESEQADHLKALGTTSAIPKIVKTGFSALELIYFFTSGPDEVRAWTIRKGWKAPQAAGTIHSDMEKGFICAEVMTWASWEEFGSEAKCKENGAYRQQGRTYEVQDGDIMFIKFNPPSKGGKK